MGPSVVTLGTFDGVHRGHQALLAEAKRQALPLKSPVLAVTFTKPPRDYFKKPLVPSLLTTPQEKEILLTRFGADRVDTLRFGPALASLPPDRFVRDYLVKRWRASTVVVGFNFRFGKGQEGDTPFLERQGCEAGVRVCVVPAVHAGGVVSSGRIRSFLAEGDLEKAQELLGHSYGAMGPVVRGRQMGRRLGYPTANIFVPDEKILPTGVFFVRVLLSSGWERFGLCNVGKNPTVSSLTPQRSLEVHVLDFVGDLVGQTISLEFLKKIRDEKKFKSLDLLKRQLREDERVGRGFVEPRF